MVDIVGGETLASLWDKLAVECGDKEFFVFEGRDGSKEKYSYREFNIKINQAANVFLSRGVTPGERVAIQMHTCPEFLMCMFGLAKIGAITVPMNEQYLQAECEYALDVCKIKRAVIEPCFVELYEQITAAGRLPEGFAVARTSRPAVARCLPSFWTKRTRPWIRSSSCLRTILARFSSPAARLTFPRASSSLTAI